MTDELSPEQRTVLESAAPRLVVRAAPGSGKTRVLVARYCAAVESGLSPDEILAVTFTRKATYDMRRRVVEALQERGRLRESRLAETGPICTLHSFCDRLLRENALAAGVDPDFKHLGDVNESETLLRVIRETLADLALGDDAAAELIAESLGRSGRTRGRLSLEGELVQDVETALRKLRSSGHDPHSIEVLAESPERLRQSFERLMREGLSATERMIIGDSSLFDAHSLFRGAETRRHRPRWLVQATIEDEMLAMERSCGMLRIVVEVWRRYRSEMNTRQTFDQTEIEARAVRLLTNDVETAARLRARYRCVLVDEGQDLNPLQYRLLDALCSEQEVIVGDPQQSIYRFREAERRYFVERSEQLPCLRLTVNFRSAPGIVAFVDRLFGLLWGEDYVVMGSDRSVDAPFGEEPIFEGVEWWPQLEDDTMAVSRLIREMIEEGTPPGDIAVLTRTTHYGEKMHGSLNEIGVPAELHGQGRSFYTRLEVRDLANVLRALADPDDDFSLLCVLHGPMVGLSYDAIVMLAVRRPVMAALADFEPLDPGDRQKISYFLDWFRELAPVADRLPAWEMLSEVMRRTPFLSAIASRPRRRQTLANVRKLLAQAAREPELRPREFAEQVASVQTLRHPEGDAPIADAREQAVAVMTIHASKGLEFPVVVIPETLRRRRRPSPKFHIERRHGLLAARGHRPSLAYNWIAEDEKRQDDEEELRLLFVACTRAQSRLCVVVPERKGGRNDSHGAAIVSKVGDWRSPPPGIRVRRIDR